MSHCHINIKSSISLIQKILDRKLFVFGREQAQYGNASHGGISDSLQHPNERMLRCEISMPCTTKLLSRQLWLLSPCKLAISLIWFLKFTNDNNLGCINNQTKARQISFPQKVKNQIEVQFCFSFIFLAQWHQKHHVASFRQAIYPNGK